MASAKLPQRMFLAFVAFKAYADAYAESLRGRLARRLTERLTRKAYAERLTRKAYAMVIGRMVNYNKYGNYVV